MSLAVGSFFFFFKQKTAYEMRISDWSSDVCSSDLKLGDRGMMTFRAAGMEARSFFNLESFADRTIDAVGAGDALLSYATLAMLATRNEVIASILGAFAAGIECEHDGNHPVTQEKMFAKIDAVERETNYSQSDSPA